MPGHMRWPTAGSSENLADIATRGSRYGMPAVFRMRRSDACWNCSSWACRFTGSSSGRRPAFLRSNDCIDWRAPVVHTRKNWGCLLMGRSSAKRPRLAGLGGESVVGVLRAKSLSWGSCSAKGRSRSSRFQRGEGNGSSSWSGLTPNREVFTTPITGRRMLRFVFRATKWSSGRRRVDRR